MRLFFAKGTVLGDEYWLYYKGRHMRAVSIGFRIRDSHVETIKDQNVLVITKIELLEISCVAVGSNPYALSKLKWLHGSAEQLDMSELKSIVAEAVTDLFAQQATLLSELRETVEQQLDEVKSMLSDRDGFAEHMLGEDSDQSVDAKGRMAEHCNRIETMFSSGG
jgi:hypothetical protein